MIIFCTFLLFFKKYRGYNKKDKGYKLNKKEHYEKLTSHKNKERLELLEKCGLPDIDETSHCFNDSTHHTCCALGKKSREYADKSGNPIGSLSEEVYRKKYGKEPGEYTTWCTCTGSKVCSYYKDKFDDGTLIKFINNLEDKNEENAIDKLKLLRHNTPGVYTLEK